MATLYHSPLCPHSRFIRLALAEWGFAVDLVEEKVWSRRTEFLTMNPAGTTPVLIEEPLVIPTSAVIVPYLEETHGEMLDAPRLLPDTVAGRVEARRLVEWFNLKFFEEVSHLLSHEKVWKRFMSAENGGGSPDMSAIRAARSNIRYHLSYIGWLAGRRSWLAGERLTYADLAAAAHLSVCDYLGDVPWEEDETARHWYQRMKSRPGFRPLLAERVIGITPPAHYDDLDF